MTEGKTISTREAADRLGYKSISSIHYLIKKGTLLGSKKDPTAPNSHMEVDLNSVEELLALKKSGIRK